MNFITHRAAFALYPKTTFLRRLSLAIGNTMDHQEHARAKYAARGWQYIGSLTSAQMTGWDTHFGPELFSGERRVGDRWTWSIPLKTTYACDNDNVCDTTTLNAWRLTYFSPPRGDMQLHICDNPSLKFRYTDTKLL
jgi:hypothetical protein